MPATKRKPAIAKLAPKPKQRMVAFLLPDDLIADLDTIARAESRSRARLMEVMLRESVQSYQRSRAAA